MPSNEEYAKSLKSEIKIDFAREFQPDGLIHARNKGDSCLRGTTEESL